MRIRHEPKLDFADVLIQPKRSRLKSRKDVDLTRLFTLPHSKKHISCVPIIASNMDTVGTIGAASVMQDQLMLTWLHKFHTIEELARVIDTSMNIFAMPTIGEGDDDTTILDAFWGVRIDVANGYRESFINYVKKVREQHPLLAIFAGNVCTPEITEELILSGADVVVVGIGTGGQCITRTKTGIGYPQISAIMECADAAHGLGGHIVADGGCRTSGDVAKAFAAGADFVALGTMLAGHNENTADENIVYEETGTFANEGPFLSTPTHAKVYGMSSKTAMEKYYGGVADHRAVEGMETLVPYKGPLKETLLDILGSLRSTCTYVGAERLKDLSKRTTFVRVR